MSLLVDTGVILAALARREKRHSWTKRLMVDILAGRYGVPFVTDYIVDEVLSYAAARLTPEDARKLLDLLVHRQVFRIIPLTLDVFNRAVKLYEQALPRLSFTDATAVVAAKLYDVDYIATMDERLADMHPSLYPQ
ncbi:type II toxin-antitoxin system VapC family toxin [Hyperthermus butylicus]|uniref:type II toxin-antitoxin system VapC family toxin n=1 Tax=Hyperthermus butylicus TaxID=54248 RepID=UPI000326832C|nr:PIN domain-containing protein [Hyperthermus butylicus]